MTFVDKLKKAVNKNNSLLCVGLDPVNPPAPIESGPVGGPFFEFNKNIIDQTHTFVCAYKPNSAFYESKGIDGIRELKKTVDYIKSKYADIPIILDAKRGDIGNTNNGYVEYIYDYLCVDAVTLHPYLGKEALMPFLNRKDKGAIILCRTSNPGAGELQDLKTNNIPLYEHLAYKVAKEWDANNNCLLVVGATYPTELKRVREIVGNNIWFLVPGIGVQGGDVEKTVKSGQNNKGEGIIISASRSIIFADNPKDEAIKLKEEINKYRKPIDLMELKGTLKHKAIKEVY
ncbi:orotidine-5'-phosphate decarboxylase [Candidatus Gottesmanbacteria bacterium]|nr:orotidine-5'-phosphate decarboxylase [Candidatus Gottesmanbacteria bacterium]